MEFDAGVEIFCGDLKLRQYACSGVGGDGPDGSLTWGKLFTSAAMTGLIRSEALEHV